MELVKNRRLFEVYYQFILSYHYSSCHLLSNQVCKHSQKNLGSWRTLISRDTGLRLYCIHQYLVGWQREAIRENDDETNYLRRQLVKDNVKDPVPYK